MTTRGAPGPREGPDRGTDQNPYVVTRKSDPTLPGGLSEHYRLTDSVFTLHGLTSTGSWEDGRGVG